MSSRAKSSDIHPEFICDWPEETPNFHYGFDVGESGEYKNNTRILLVNKSDTSKMYSHSINIWSSVDACDYWFRHSHHGKYIIVSDYSGLTVFNDHLKIVFHVETRIKKKSVEDVEHLDVWGYELNNNILSYWSANAVKSIEKEYNDKMHILTTENRAKLSNKERKIANNAIEYMNAYSKSYNIPLELINKATLEIEPHDLENKVNLPIQQHYIYIFVNTSLSMKNGKIASQISHLARTMTLNIFSKNEDDDIVKSYNDWVTTGSKIILSKASDSQIQKLASLSGSCAIIDEGHTQVEPNSLTVLGFYPSQKKSEFASYQQDHECFGYTRFFNTFEQPMQEILPVVDFSESHTPMYMIVDKTSDLTRYKLVTRIFQLSMCTINHLVKSSKDGEYMTNFMRWIDRGAKTIILKVDNEQLSKISEFGAAYKLFNTCDNNSQLCMVGFLPFTIGSSVLSSYKLY